MGCGSSKPDGTDRPARPAQGRAGGQQVTISAPSGGPQMVPPTYRDYAGRPITHQDFELDRDTLVQALDHMGRYLDGRGVTVRLITVGGAVNTIYLQSRETTHDVDFFMEDPESLVHTVIHEAARSAARSFSTDRGVTLGANWFNNTTQLLMSGQIQSRLARDAIQQNTIIHQYRGSRGGLIVYAAPWSYAFCGKINRLSGANPRPYDVDDAVVYLHQYLRVSNMRSVTRTELVRWCHDYRKDVTDAALDQVNMHYYQAYQRQAIVR